jgi:Uma2 family endonuclease
MLTMMDVDELLPEIGTYRPLKRVEYDKLVAEGCFEDERVELLFGMVVPMVPIDPAHDTSQYFAQRALTFAIGPRAQVRVNASFAASEISEPVPDIFVTPEGSYWKEHPDRAFLIVEVSRSSLRRDRKVKTKLYGLAHVDEYWIVNHVDRVVEVHRDPHEGTWRQISLHHPGDSIAMLAFPDVTIAVSDILPPDA